VADVRAWLESADATDAAGYNEDFPAVASSLLLQLPPRYIDASTEADKAAMIERRHHVSASLREPGRDGGPRHLLSHGGAS
jgi:hypothetical protein